MAIAQERFGRTGHLSSRVLFGGAALARVTQDEADRALELLLHHGVNHLDVAPHGSQDLHIHLVAAISNGLILEFYRDSVDPMWGQMFRDTLRVNADGTVTVNFDNFSVECR